MILDLNAPYQTSENLLTPEFTFPSPPRADVKENVYLQGSTAQGVSVSSRGNMDDPE